MVLEGRDDLPEQVWSDWQKRKINVVYVGSRPGMFSTIQEAIGRAQRHDRVEVMSGTYNEAIVITKEIELCAMLGESPEIVMWGTCLTLSCPTTGYICGIDLVQMDKNHEIPSLCVTDGSPIVTQCRFPSVLVQGSATPHLERNEITDSWSTSGIRLKAYAGGVFHRNVVYSHSNFCVELHNAGSTLFTENDFGIVPGKVGRRGKGIIFISFDVVKFGHKPQFIENRITDPNDDRVVADRSDRRRDDKSADRRIDGRSRCAVFVAELSHCEFVANDFTQCETGVRIYGHSTLKDNMFSRLKGYGVSLMDGCEATLEDNRFFECEGAAIEVVNSSPTLLRNRISGFTRGGDGVVMSSTKQAAIPPAPRLEGNVFSRVRGTGVKCVNTNGQFVENMFEEATGSSMVLLGRDSQPTIEKNRFLVGSGQAIVCGQDSRPLVNNNFISHYEVGVSVIARARPVVTNNEILECLETGILCSNRAFGLFEGNTVDTCKNAITVQSYARPHLRGNTLSYSKNAALRCRDFCQPYVEKNNICDNKGSGMEVSEHADPVVYDNVFSRCIVVGIAFTENAFGTFAFNKFDCNGMCASVREGSKPTFRKNTFLKSPTAVSVADAALGVFEKNNIVDCGDGIVVSGKDSNPEIMANSFVDIHTQAISFATFCKGRAVDNVFKDTLVGVVIKESSTPLVFKNRFLSVTSACIIIKGLNSAPHVHNNTILGSSGRGIDCEEGCNPRLTNNMICGCQMGVRLRGKGVVRDNTFKNNVYGVVADNSCTAHVTSNKFTGSTEACISVLAQAAGTFEDNDMTASTVGVLVEGATAKAVFERNNIAGNDVGVKAHRDEGRKGKTLFVNNDIHESKIANVCIDAVGYMTMKRNDIHHAPVGVICRQGGRGLFEDNSITSSDEANVRVLSNANPIFKQNRVESSKIGFEVIEGGRGVYAANQFDTVGKTMMVSTKAEPTVTHSEISGSSEDGLVLRHGAGGTYRCSNFSHNAGHGIVVGPGCSPVFEENVISCNGLAGVNIVGEATCTFRRNRIHNNHAEGVAMAEGCRPVIEQNEITRNNIGLGLYGHAYGRIMENNIFMNNEAGVVVSDASHPHFELNVVLKEEVGIRFKNGAGGVYENRIVQCDVGCILEAGARPDITRNVFALNDVACQFGADALGSVSHNILYANAIGAQVDKNGKPKLLQNLFTLRSETADCLDGTEWGSSQVASKDKKEQKGSDLGLGSQDVVSPISPSSEVAISQKAAPVRLSQFLQRGNTREPGGLTNPRPLGLPAALPAFNSSAVANTPSQTPLTPPLRSPARLRADLLSPSPKLGGNTSRQGNTPRTKLSPKLSPMEPAVPPPMRRRSDGEPAPPTGLAEPPKKAVGVESLGGGGSISHNVFVHIPVGVVCRGEGTASVVSWNCFSDGDIGVEVVQQAAPRLDGNKFHNHRTCGIKVSSYALPRVMHNIIARESVGILLAVHAEGIYEKNTLDANGVGCLMENQGSSHPVIRSNQFAENSTGVLARCASAGRVLQNYFVANQSHGMAIEDKSDVVVTENCFSYHSELACGLCIRNDGLGQVKRNVFALNATAVQLETGGNPVISDNLLAGQLGVAVRSGDRGRGTLRNNAFRANKADITMERGALTVVRGNSIDNDVTVDNASAVFEHNTITGRVRVSGSEAEPTLSRNYFYGQGVQFDSGARGRLVQNTFTKVNDKTWAIEIQGQADPTIAENQFWGVRSGLLVTNAGKGLIESNTFQSGKTGMEVRSGQPVVSSNVFETLERGMVFTGAEAGGDVTDVQVVNCSQSSVTIEKGGDPKFEGCELFDSHVGLRVSNAKGRLAGCDIYDNQTGVQLLQDSMATISYCRISSPSDAGCVSKEFHGLDRNTMEQNTLRNQFSPFSPARKNYKRDRDDERRRAGRKDFQKVTTVAERKMRDHWDAEDRVIANVMWILRLHKLDGLDFSPKAVLKYTEVPPKPRDHEVPTYLERTPDDVSPATSVEEESLRQSQTKVRNPLFADLDKEEGKPADAPKDIPRRSKSGGSVVTAAQAKSVRGGARRRTAQAVGKVLMQSRASSRTDSNPASRPGSRRQSKALSARRGSEAPAALGSPSRRASVLPLPDDGELADSERAGQGRGRGSRRASRDSRGEAPKHKKKLSSAARRASAFASPRRRTQDDGRPPPAATQDSPDGTGQSSGENTGIPAPRHPKLTDVPSQPQQQRLLRTTRRKSSALPEGGARVGRSGERKDRGVDEAALHGLQALSPVDSDGAVRSGLLAADSGSPVAWGRDSPRGGTDTDARDEINFYSGLARVIRPGDAGMGVVDTTGKLAVTATALGRRRDKGQRQSHVGKNDGEMRVEVESPASQRKGGDARLGPSEWGLLQQRASRLTTGLAAGIEQRMSKSPADVLMASLVQMGDAPPSSVQVALLASPGLYAGQMPETAHHSPTNRTPRSAHSSFGNHSESVSVDPPIERLSLPSPGLLPASLSDTRANPAIQPPQPPPVPPLPLSREGQEDTHELSADDEAPEAPKRPRRPRAAPQAAAPHRPLVVVNKDGNRKVEWVWGVVRAGAETDYDEDSEDIPHSRTYPASVRTPRLPAPGFYFHPHTPAGAVPYGVGPGGASAIAQTPRVASRGRRREAAPARDADAGADAFLVAAPPLATAEAAGAVSLPSLPAPDSHAGEGVSPAPPKWGSSTQPVRVRKLPRGPPPVETHLSPPRGASLPEMTAERLRRVAPHLKRTLKMLETTHYLDQAQHRSVTDRSADCVGGALL